MFTKQNYSQEQPQKERTRGQGCGQANYSECNRGGNSLRLAPYCSGGDRNHGAALKAGIAATGGAIQCCTRR